MIVEMRSEGLIQRSALSLEGYEVQIRPFNGFCMLSVAAALNDLTVS